MAAGTWKLQLVKLMLLVAVVCSAVYFFRFWVFDNILPLLAPEHMPILPPGMKNDPISAPSITVAVKDSVMRAAADAMVNDGWDFTLADENGWFPRKMIVRLEKIDTFEFTDRGTIHVVLSARPMVISMISASVGIKKLEVEF